MHLLADAMIRRIGTTHIFQSRPHTNQHRQTCVHSVSLPQDAQQPYRRAYHHAIANDRLEAPQAGGEAQECYSIDNVGRTFTVWIPTLTTLAGIDTSEKNAPGPPGSSRSTMKPSMSRWKPSETWAVEKANIMVAMATSSLLTLGVRRRMVSMVRHDQYRMKFMPILLVSIIIFVYREKAVTHHRTSSQARWRTGRPCRAGCLDQAWWSRTGMQERSPRHTL